MKLLVRHYFSVSFKSRLTSFSLQVATLLVLDAANAAFDVWWVYDALVTKFGTRPLRVQLPSLSLTRVFRSESGLVELHHLE